MQVYSSVTEVVPHASLSVFAGEANLTLKRVADTAIDAEEMLAGEDKQHWHVERLNDALSRLDGREKDIVTQRYFTAEFEFNACKTRQGIRLFQPSSVHNHPPQNGRDIMWALLPSDHVIPRTS